MAACQHRSSQWRRILDLGRQRVRYHQRQSRPECQGSSQRDRVLGSRQELKRVSVIRSNN